ncbi:MAG: hypothetical protein K9N09_11190 [Candidatus Cloacimonetes bacterium]|nr:hypothetical protein [Candidatus Cloacimonadota bacterium]MCF7815036.1 hypothetical protein [Candidatus Cloacimonadota bacterium]MCF7869251.1 hypothetical protein [Candidatus Cloacimonadota bacterium]MCF7884685.1 hypothetical protein [Candidatus Cloacimonadota bacterium]
MFLQTWNGTAPASRISIKGNTGKVGIGTENPTEQLHVNGNVKADTLKTDGVIINSAANDGVYVYEVGTPSAHNSSSTKNGFEVAGAEGFGLFVGRADDHGVFVSSAGEDGVYVSTTGEDGVFVYTAGDDGVQVNFVGDNYFQAGGDGNEKFYVNSSGSLYSQSFQNISFAAGGNRYLGLPDNSNSLFLGSTSSGGAPYSMFLQTWNGTAPASRISIKGNTGKVGIGTENPTEQLHVNGNVKADTLKVDGVVINSAGDDGVYVYEVGTPSAHNSSSTKNGFEVAGAQGNGLFVGRADDHGVCISSAGGDGVYVWNAGTPSTHYSSYSKNGFEVAGAEGHGLYVGKADDGGVYVGSAGTPTTSTSSYSTNGF